MARVHYETRLAAERRFPHRVDVPAPAGGLGGRLDAMHEWCRANVAADRWEQHGQSERQPDQIAQYFARFYFMDVSDADLFRRRWL
jgi:hypothetical protein